MVPPHCTAPLVACGADCVDLTTDASHCGACFAACDGDCAQGRCILTLAAGLDEPNPLALDGDDVYVGVEGDISKGASGSIFRVSKAGGAQTVAASNLILPSMIALDSVNLYYADADALYEVPRAGGKVTQLVGDQNSLYSFAIANKTLYWTVFANGQPGDGFVESLDVGSGLVPHTFSPGYGAIAVAGQDAFVATSTGLLRVPLAGGMAVKLADGSGGNAGHGVAVDAQNVYWANENDGTIVQVPRQGGSVITLATSQLQPVAVAVDAGNVYWVTISGGTVAKVPIGGGPITTIAMGESTPCDIAVDATSVYWVSSGDLMPGAGALKKATPK
jgi:hypothetical protein